MTEKTAIIWLDPAEGTIQYFVVDGDWRAYDGVVINCCENQKVEDALNAAMYDDNGNYRIQPVPRDSFVTAIRQGAYVIEAGFCS